MTLSGLSVKRKIAMGCFIAMLVYFGALSYFKIGKDTVVSHSIIMNETEIGEGCSIEKGIIAEKVKIGSGVTVGAFEEKPNETKPGIYCEGLCTIGEKSVIPNDVKIGKNTMISGITTLEDYHDGILDSGRTLDKAGD